VTVIVTALPVVATEEVAALVVLLIVANAVEDVDKVDDEADAAVLPGAAEVVFAKEVVDPTVAEVVDADFCDVLPEVEEAAREATVLVKGGLLAPQAMFNDTGRDVT